MTKHVSLVNFKFIQWLDLKFSFIIAYWAFVTDNSEKKIESELKEGKHSVNESREKLGKYHLPDVLVFNSVGTMKHMRIF